MEALSIYLILLLYHYRTCITTLFLLYKKVSPIVAGIIIFLSVCCSYKYFYCVWGHARNLDRCRCERSSARHSISRRWIICSPAPSCRIIKWIRCWILMCTVGAQKRRAISVIHFSSIEKGYEVYRRYICVVNSSEMNGILLFHEFIRDLIVVLLSQVTTSLCRAPLKIARLLYLPISVFIWSNSFYQSLTF